MRSAKNRRLQETSAVMDSPDWFIPSRVRIRWLQDHDVWYNLYIGIGFATAGESGLWYFFR